MHFNLLLPRRNNFRESTAGQQEMTLLGYSTPVGSMPSRSAFLDERCLYPGRERREKTT